MEERLMCGGRKLVRRSTVVVLLLLAAAGPASATTLREALVASYLTNPQLEAGRSELRQTDELVPQALSGYRPNVFLNGELTGERAKVRQGEDFDQNRVTRGVNLTLRQN